MGSGQTTGPMRRTSPVTQGVQGIQNVQNVQNVQTQKIAVPRIQSASAVASESGAALRWDNRLYQGLRVAAVEPEIRGALARALGEVGVEAEFFLLLVNGFPGAGRPTHVRGQAFLRQLEGAGQRLIAIAAALELATQGYLSALEAAHPELRGATSENEDVWWPPFAGYTLEGEPLEARLRRCGYAFRHVSETYLSTHVEAILDQLALTLYALSSLPPAGVTPLRALYQGLYELSSSLQGDIVPHHIRSASAQYPGLLASISRLRGLDAQDDTSIAGDLAWAQAQYTYAYNAYMHTGASPARINASAHTGDTHTWAAQATNEWRTVIGFLEHLRTSAS